MMKITPKPYEKIGVTLRKFRKLCEREGLMRDIRRNAVYEKPSEKKRREKLRTIKRIQKEQIEEEIRINTSRKG